MNIFRKLQNVLPEKAPFPLSWPDRYCLPDTDFNLILSRFNNEKYSADIA